MTSGPEWMVAPHQSILTFDFELGDFEDVPTQQPQGASQRVESFDMIKEKVALLYVKDGRDADVGETVKCVGDVDQGHDVQGSLARPFLPSKCLYERNISAPSAKES